MSKLIEFIAEDMSDIEVLKILIGKISTRKFSSAQFVGKGCGPIKKKLPGWSKAFIHKGVDSLLVVHDLDRNEEGKLRQDLESLIYNMPFRVKAVVIPKEELEAWLLCDETAIQSAMKLEHCPKPITDPETISSPKEHLRDLTKIHSKGGYKKYVNTIHNKAIALKIEKSKLSKCASFSHLQTFVHLAL